MARALAATDAELVEGARLGDAAAFDALVRRYARAAFAVALSATRDDQDAEDACQDAFVRALERLEECRRPSQFAGWLLAIVRNRAQNVRRREHVRRAASLDTTEIANRDSPSRDAERSELRARLTAALGTLSAEECDVVLLHDLEGRTHGEIAGALGITDVASRQRLFQARTRLREQLRDLSPRRVVDE
jgi:RNA polymerase sigma-70 factor (ECF subfamily)